MRALLRGLVGLWLLVLALPAAAQDFPALTGRVVDDAHLLTPAQVVDLTTKLESLETRTGRQLVVTTQPSLQGRTIEDYGYRLGRAWGIGSKDKDDGVILIVAPKEKKVRIETGYGARVFLTDAVSSVIVRDVILPRFRQGDFGGGIVAGTDQIIGMMELPAAEAAKRASQIGAAEQKREKSGGGVPVFLLVFLFFFIVLPIFKAIARAGQRGRRGRAGRRHDGIDPWVVLWGLDALSRSGRSSGWGGGGGSDWGGFGGGGGGFSGGGGSFGGGGASGGW